MRVQGSVKQVEEDAGGVEKTDRTVPMVMTTSMIRASPIKASGER